MRSISSAGLAKLATNQGTEPVNIIEIQWTAGGPISSYSDRDIPPYVQGRILSLANMDNTVKISEGGENATIEVTMDDTDKTIKAILDANDIHKRPVWVYQWFEGLDLTDKFLLFKGQINSPVTWDEGARSVTFTIMSLIESVEVGFSIEEGNFPAPPYFLIGKAWPLCFGTTVDVPCLREVNLFVGTLASGVGIADFTIPLKIQAAQGLSCPTSFKGYSVLQDPGLTSITFIEQWGADPACVIAKCQTITNLQFQLAQQQQYEYGQITVFSNPPFPQNTPITLDINGGIFTGSMNGNVFTITSRRHPAYLGLVGVPGYAGPAYTLANGLENYLAYVGLAQFMSSDGINNLIALKNSFYVGTGCPGDKAFGTPYTQSTVALALSAQAQRFLDNIPSADFFWAPAGSTVALVGQQQVRYISNLLPSTVLSVKSFRQFDTGSVLVTVPAEYYQVLHTNFSSYLCTEIVFSIPLSQRGPGWNDEIYVTQISSVGPNTADILSWLITTYTTYTPDPTTFAHVRSVIDNYPTHFPILERKNILQTLEEIAFQSRCTIFLRNDIFYLIYLSEEPTSVATITEDLVEAKTLQITHTPTEDLITRFTSTWIYDHAYPEPDLIIQRFNVAKYGLHPLTYDFYAYNIQQLVEKSTTFWLIRKSNTWRRIVLTTSLSLLNVETYDCVTVNLADFAPMPIKCIVERADYDSASNRIKMELWTPVLSGQQVAYDFAFPANVDELALFPLITELRAGWAGAGFSPGFFTAAPQGHPLNTAPDSTLFQGANLSTGCLGDITNYAEVGCRPDFGDRYPSDEGDQKPSVDAASDPGAVTGGQDPTNLANLELQQQIQQLQDAVAEANANALQAQSVANAANEAAKGAGSSGGSGNGSTNEDGTKNPDVTNLPTRQQLEDQMKQAGKGDQIACLSSTCTSWFPVTTIVLFGLPICVPAGKPVTECFSFNSSSGAANFAAAAGDQGATLSSGHSTDGCSPDFQTITITPLPGSCVEGDGSMMSHDRTVQINGIDTPAEGPSITDSGFTNMYAAGAYPGP